MKSSVLEVRKQDSSEYPQRLLHYTVCDFLSYLSDQNIHKLDFLDEKDYRFDVFQRVFDARMKEFFSKGLQSKLRQVDLILPEDEDKTWMQEVFGLYSSKALKYTVSFYNCKRFGLHAFDELKSLECDQFKFGCDGRAKYIHFHGKWLKTFKGGLTHLPIQNKGIKHHCPNGKLS
jgi:hypothetical protein